MVFTFLLGARHGDADLAVWDLSLGFSQTGGESQLASSHLENHEVTFLMGVFVDKDLLLVCFCIDP